jgi:hypothetical protein
MLPELSRRQCRICWTRTCILTIRSRINVRSSGHRSKVGVALFPNDGTDAATLLQNAGSCAQKARRAAIDTCFTRRRPKRSPANSPWRISCAGRSDRQEFRTHYQPR